MYISRPILETINTRQFINNVIGYYLGDPELGNSAAATLSLEESKMLLMYKQMHDQMIWHNQVTEEVAHFVRLDRCPSKRDIERFQNIVRDYIDHDKNNARVLMYVPEELLNDAPLYFQQYYRARLIEATANSVLINYPKDVIPDEERWKKEEPKHEWLYDFKENISKQNLITIRDALKVSDLVLVHGSAISGVGNNLTLTARNIGEDQTDDLENTMTILGSCWAGSDQKTVLREQFCAALPYFEILKGSNRREKMLMKIEHDWVIDPIATLGRRASTWRFMKFVFMPQI
ncbi:MAG: hypothetical protein Q4E47_01705 [Candidatus Saccharibacteria bacterium]|nr:hypothetical protein [Candidatus Saccharibacteria bacterium]